MARFAYRHLYVLASLLVLLVFIANSHLVAQEDEEDTSTSTTAADAGAAHDPFANLKFRNLGPTVGGGRVSAVAGVPGQPNIYYVGAAAGGVFKTIDGGISWKAIFEKEPVASIGAIAIAPSNASLVWVGTGEANLRNDISGGRGVYFSPDAGASWRFMGLENVGQISNVIVSPDNPNVVFVAAIGHAWAPNPDRGVYRTLDGGRTWQRVLYVDDHTGASDLVMVPGNPMVLLAGMWQVQRFPWALASGGHSSGIYRSTDGGNSWKKLTDGLPEPPLGRIGVAVAPSNANHVYALIEARKGMLWQSIDLGDHWTKVSDSHLLDVRPFYFSHVFVAPDDENKLYFLSFVIAESKDGGKSAHSISRHVHPDHHAMWIDPQNPKRIIEGNDGGVYLSSDAGRSWKFLDNLPIEQFYQVAADSSTPYHLCGGLQDNDGWCGPSNSLSRSGITDADWWVAVGGDGEYVVPAPSNPNVIYADSQDGDIERLDSRNGLARTVRPYLSGVEETSPDKLKYRFNWTSPISVSSRDPNTVYLGGNVLFKSTDGGQHWNPISPDLSRNDKSKQFASGGPIDLDLSGAETSDTILSMALSSTDENVIWVGTDDGLIQVTRDGGTHWTNVSIPNLPAWGRIQQIEVSPFSPAACYVAVDFHELDNDHPYVFKTHDFGHTWSAIARGLPPTDPARVVREDPNLRGFLIVGTETGLFYSRDDGSTWSVLKSNFPTVPIYDLKFVKKTHDLVVATHGRGLFVLDNITALEQFTPQVANSDFHLFTPANAYKWFFWTRREGSASGLAVPNPPTDAALDYYLAKEIKPTPEQKQKHETPVKITVTDARGTLVRTFWGPSKQGINRAEWDLAYDAPRKLAFAPLPENEPYERNVGPPVTPGQYRVTVTVDGKSQSEAIDVAPDPRLPADMQAFEEQSRVALSIRDDLNALDDALNRLDSMHQQLKTVQTLLQPADDTQQPRAEYLPVIDQSKALDKKIVALRDDVYNSQAQTNVGEDDIHYFQHFYDLLRSMMSQVTEDYDQRPSEIQMAKLAELRQQLASYLNRFNALLKTDVASFNQLALQHGANTVFAGVPIEIKGRAVQATGAK